ncbi:MAG: hypothetical protein ABSF46_18965 [Terriglobia bacterium]
MRVFQAYTVVGNRVGVRNNKHYPVVATQTATVSNSATTTITVDDSTIIPTHTKVLDAAGMSSLTVSPDGRPSHARFEFKPEYEEFDAYFNFDYGTGRIRGVFLEGDEAARPILRASLRPFNDLGAATLSIAGVGSTDHMSFDEIGLPGFQWIRDYMEGNDTRAPHTNMDTYDHDLEDDLKQSAAVAAFVIYDLAVREEKLPRKPLPAH